MIPSDHFVRFYNEVFKFLESRNGLLQYYQEISRHQEFHCLELFREKGLEGMDEYWGKIKVEENCDCEGGISDGVRWGHMKKCPSLSKILDSDAKPCNNYCEHCPGWVLPLLTKCGFYSVYNMMAPDKPECYFIITADLEKARVIYRDWKARYPASQLQINFEEE